jgi:hypothetical protein
MMFKRPASVKTTCKTWQHVCHCLLATLSRGWTGAGPVGRKDTVLVAFLTTWKALNDSNSSASPMKTLI